MVLLVNGAVGISPSEQINQWIVMFVWSIPLMVYAELLMAFLQARKRFHEIARVSAASKVTAVVIGVALTWLFGAWGFVASLLIGQGLGVFLYFRRIGGGWLGAQLGGATARRLQQLAVFSLLANLIGPLNNQLDLLLLDRLVLDRQQLGTYSLAIIFFTALMQLYNTLQMMIIPNLSELSGRKAEFRVMLKRYGLVLSVVCSIMAVAAAGIVPLGVAWLFGEKYQGFALIFLVMTIRFVANTPWSMARVSLVALGRMDQLVFATMLVLPITVVSTLWMVQVWGIIGAAWAQVVGTVCLGLVALASSSGASRALERGVAWRARRG